MNLDDILDELRRLAVDGHAPSSKRYDRHRRDGLRLARRRRRKAAEATRAALISDSSDADGLAVLEQTRRVTERTVVLPDGSAVRLIKESYSLR